MNQKSRIQETNCAEKRRSNIYQHYSQAKKSIKVLNLYSLEYNLKSYYHIFVLPPIKRRFATNYK
jgi:hypothetical protein